jgi:hypothetical protein
MRTYSSKFIFNKIFIKFSLKEKLFQRTAKIESNVQDEVKINPEDDVPEGGDVSMREEIEDEEEKEKEQGMYTYIYIHIYIYICIYLQILM